MPKLLSLMEAVGVCPLSIWRSEAIKKVVGAELPEAGVVLESGSVRLRFRGGAATTLPPVEGRILASRLQRNFLE